MCAETLRRVGRWVIGLVGGLGCAVALAQEGGVFHGVVLNGVTQTGFALLMLDEAARPYMAPQDFLRLGLSQGVAPVTIEGVDWVPLTGHPGLTVRMDTQSLLLHLEVEPHWYAPTRLNLHAPAAGQPLPALLGALLNYSLQTRSNGPGPAALAGTQQWSLFGAQGLLQVNTAFRSSAAAGQEEGLAKSPRFSRLATTFVRDDVQHLSTWSLGDEVLQAAAGVPAVRYGGVTWQSHFGLNPAFSTLESPTLFDAARLPSTLEFFLNDRRVGPSVAVAPGPFEISGLPTVGMRGQVSVLIRDALLNERTVSVPYLRSTSLYRPGLHSFSYTAAWLRPELNSYQTPFVSTAHRWGVTRRVTLDAGATLGAAQSSAGLGATLAVWGPLLGAGHVALSHTPQGLGQQWDLSAQWQGTQTHAGASYSHASETFGLLGDTVLADARPQNDARFFAARALDHDWGSVSVSLGSLSVWRGRTRTLRSLAWSHKVGAAHVSLSAVRTSDKTWLQVLWSMPLERRAFVSASVQNKAQDSMGRIDYTSAPVTGEGVAWRLAGVLHAPSTAPTRTGLEASVDVHSRLGQHGVDVSGGASAQAWRVRTAGSVGLLGGHFFAGPPIEGGFALVSTGDAPHIPVYRWNLPVAVSDAQGMALVTHLSPYQKNLLAIKPEDVPLQYRVDRHDITAIPRGRGGVWVDFPVLRERPAVLVLTWPNGEVLPVGSWVRVLPTGAALPLGLRGEVYLPHLPTHAALQVHVQVKGLDHTCPITVEAPATDDPQPRLGPYVCTPILAPWSAP